MAKKFPIEKQIDYFLAEQRYVHPPSTICYVIITDQGAGALPAVLARMKTSNDDHDKIELLRVVENIHNFHHNLSRDEEILAQLNQVVACMTNPTLKASAEQTLAKIVENRSLQDDLDR